MEFTVDSPGAASVPFVALSRSTDVPEGTPLTPEPTPGAAPEVPTDSTPDYSYVTGYPESTIAHIQVGLDYTQQDLENFIGSLSGVQKQVAEQLIGKLRNVTQRISEDVAAVNGIIKECEDLAGLLDGNRDGGPRSHIAAANYKQQHIFGEYPNVQSKNDIVEPITYLEGHSLGKLFNLPIRRSKQAVRALGRTVVKVEGIIEYFGANGRFNQEVTKDAAFARTAIGGIQTYKKSH